jgi:hypothetical protein
MTCLKELVIQGAPFEAEKLPVPVEISSLEILYVDDYYPLSFFTAPSLQILHLDDILPVPLPTAVETFLRGVSHLGTLAFNINTDVLDCIPKLDHVILLNIGTAKRVVLDFLVRQPIARFLKTITISTAKTHKVKRGIRTLCELTTIVQHWGEHQLPNLRRLVVHVYDDGKEDMSPAIDGLVRLEANRGFEVDVKVSPFQIVPPFGDL